MSAQALNWAWEQELPASEKFLLVALGDQARGDGLVLHGPQLELAAMTCSGERTVRRNLAKLENEHELLRRYPQYEEGRRVADLIKLAVDGTLDLPANLTGGQSGRALTSSVPPSEGSTGGSEGKRPARSAGGIEWPLDAAHVSEEMRRDAEELLRAKRRVASRQVTAAEMVIAACAVAAFNAALDRDLGVGPALDKVVPRVRDRPSWDAAKHVRLVNSACRLRWWERNGRSRQGLPDLGVVYGPRAFEKVVQEAADEAAGRSRETQPRRAQRSAPTRRQSA